jgi:hypothetical protein
MPGGGFSKLPNGSVVVALSLPSPVGDGATVRFLVHAANRARALTRLRNLGLRAVYLRGNSQPPTPDEITAVLHHPDGLLWRSHPETTQELWHPIRALLRPTRAAPRLNLPQTSAGGTPTRREFPAWAGSSSFAGEGHGRRPSGAAPLSPSGD